MNTIQALCASLATVVLSVVMSLWTSGASDAGPATTIACSGCFLGTVTPNPASCSCVVSIAWGANSHAGTCKEPPGSCTELTPCQIGKFEMTVSGSCKLRLWSETLPGFEDPVEINGDISRTYGSATTSDPLECGQEWVRVVFPDCPPDGGMNSHGGIRCTACVP